MGGVRPDPNRFIERPFLNRFLDFLGTEVPLPYQNFPLDGIEDFLFARVIMAAFGLPWISKVLAHLTITGGFHDFFKGPARIA